EFFKVIVGSAAAWPLVARAQQPEQMRRGGLPMKRSGSEAEGLARLPAFKQAIEKIGGKRGPNIIIAIWYVEEQNELHKESAGGAGRAWARRHPCQWHNERDGLASSQPYDTDRIRGGGRSGRCRFR